MRKSIMFQFKKKNLDVFISFLKELFVNIPYIDMQYEYDEYINKIDIKLSFAEKYYVEARNIIHKYGI